MLSVRGMLILVMAAVVVVASMGGTPTWAQMSDEEILEELRRLKERVKHLEDLLQGRAAERKEPMDQEFLRIRSENERVVRELQTMEKGQQEMRGLLEGLSERVTISGLLEVEGAYTRKSFKERDDEDSSDIVLATAQIELDARIREWVKAHMILLWEEDETEPLDVDEGTITLGATDSFPFYLLAGKFYPHFSEYNTYMISDPLTLELAELRESAVSVGYVSPWFDAGVGTFNSDVSNVEGDTINGFWAEAALHCPEGFPFPFTLGAGYLNNIADSNNLREEVAVDKLEDLVGALSVYGIVQFGPVALSAEYVTALDDFRAGELGFAVLDGVEREAKPAAWNIEAAYGFLEKFQIAARYAGTQDLYAWFPQAQYGATLGWEFTPGTTFSIEYLHGEFDDNDEGLDAQDVVTTQLAVVF
jgi:hypothetical protein